MVRSQRRGYFGDALVANAHIAEVQQLQPVATAGREGALEEKAGQGSSLQALRHVLPVVTNAHLTHGGVGLQGLQHGACPLLLHLVGAEIESLEPSPGGMAHEAAKGIPCAIAKVIAPDEQSLETPAAGLEGGLQGLHKLVCMLIAEKVVGEIEDLYSGRDRGEQWAHGLLPMDAEALVHCQPVVRQVQLGKLRHRHERPREGRGHDVAVARAEEAPQPFAVCHQCRKLVILSQTREPEVVCVECLDARQVDVAEPPPADGEDGHQQLPGAGRAAGPVAGGGAEVQGDDVVDPQEA
mmetsp:Transcript_73260/g.218604  ORF Transcript_73260/g.218604 Transcript_73260/m.218604 type:complete len:296 (-) Transcript_73260:544-1431(-)